MMRQGPIEMIRQPARGGGATRLPRGTRMDRQVSRKSVSVSVTASSMPPNISIPPTINMPPTIIVVDDDDDILISSPRRFAQAKSAVSSSRQRSQRSQSRENQSRASSTEDPLALRLGPTNYIPGRQADKKKPRDRNRTIDLTAVPVIDNDCILVNEFVQKKRKPAQPTSEARPPVPAKDLKLTCAICMDSMKEETSTMCGHIFCRRCIFGAIAVQKKCPTCRQALTTQQTHRIYISGHLKNS